MSKYKNIGKKTEDELKYAGHLKRTSKSNLTRGAFGEQVGYETSVPWEEVIRGKK